MTRIIFWVAHIRRQLRRRRHFHRANFYYVNGFSSLSNPFLYVKSSAAVFPSCSDSKHRRYWYRERSHWQRDGKFKSPLEYAVAIIGSLKRADPLDAFCK